MTDAYADHVHHVAPARSFSTLGRFALSLILIWIAATVLATAYWPLVGFPGVEFGIDGEPATLADAARLETYNATRPSNTIFGLLFFLTISVPLLVVLRLFHARGLFSLIGNLTIARRDFLSCVVAIFAVTALIHVLFPFDTSSLEQPLSFGAWLMLLPVAAAALFVQTTTEELLFRGFIQQQLGARFASPLIWMVAPSVAFGLWHFDPALSPQVNASTILWTGLFGLAAADLTARTGTLGAAMGLHFANNVFATLVFSWPGFFGGLALFVYPETQIEADWHPISLIYQLMILWLSWLACRVAIRA